MEAAASREAKEETGLDIEIKELVGIYSDPGRDPRRHTVSACYLAAGSGTLTAGTDASDAVLFALDHIPKLAFDHDLMIADAFLRFSVRKIGVVRSSVKGFVPRDRWGAGAGHKAVHAARGRERSCVGRSAAWGSIMC